MKRRSASVAIFFVAIVLAGCARDNGAMTLLGTLEWDRIALPAEVSEPITQILVKEGDRVAADQLLVQLDARRTQAQADAEQADVQRLTAALDELRHGARVETIDASRAALARAQAAAANAQIARDRGAGPCQRTQQPGGPRQRERGAADYECRRQRVAGEPR